MALLAGCSGTSVVAAASGQASPEASGMDAYPPMPRGVVPGASPQVRAMAKRMGRGINFGNMLDAPNEGDWGLRVEDRFINLIGVGNFARTVRLPVRWSNHASADAQALIEPAFMARVADVVDRLLARGATVVLNMHHYRQLDGDALDKGEKPVDPSVLELRFLAMWKQIAARFASRTPQLLFEPYNEPHKRLDPLWNDLFSRALRVIRQTNPSRIVVVGPGRWNNPTALTGLVLPADPNLLITVHHYEPFRYTHQGAEWSSPPMPTGIDCCNDEQLALMRRLLDQTVSESTRLGYPAFVGEFGAYSKASPESRLRYSRFMRDEMEKRALPWQYWELASGFGVYDPAAGAFRTDLYEALYGL
jgi:endoglucanase